jgi:hypothetical protein
MQRHGPEVAGWYPNDENTPMSERTFANADPDTMPRTIFTVMEHLMRAALGQPTRTPKEIEEQMNLLRPTLAEMTEGLVEHYFGKTLEIAIAGRAIATDGEVSRMQDAIDIAIAHYNKGA